MSGIILGFVGSTILIYVTALQIVLERPEVQFIDKELIGNINFTVRRLHRRSPYLVLCSFDLIYTMGNNVTMFFQLFEYSSGGRYLPTTAILRMKMCDLFNKDPYVGKMLAKQFPPNMTCPFKPGVLICPAFELRLDNFPYMLPFSLGSKNIRGKCDVTWLVTTTNQTIAKISMYLKFILD